VSLIVPPFGSVDVVVPASGIVTAFSQGSFQILQSVVNANVPAPFTVLTNVAAGASAPFTSSAFSAGATVRIEAVGGRSVSYDVGLAPAAKLERTSTVQGAVVSAVNVSATLTVPQIAGGIVTSTTAAAVAMTLPTGAVMDSSGSWAIGEGCRWSIINTGAANAVTLTAAASGHTIVGAAGVPLSTSGEFVTLKTAAATFISYRV
jgi:hypothetical protein